MTNQQRDRIAAAFDRELDNLPFPPELRSQAVRAAAAGRHAPSHPRHQWALALVAAFIAVAVVATLVVGTRGLRPAPAKTGPPPPPRAEAGVAYDAAHGQLVLFGGRTETQYFLNETWTFDGKGWTQMHPKVSPPGRQMAGMAYDAARHQVVLVGGTVNQTGRTVQVPLNDTWTWDGRVWTQQHPANNAPAVQSMPLAYDPASRMVIAFYVEPVVKGKPHTLGWNGTDWVELHPAAQPTNSYGSFAWDGTRLIFLGDAQQEGGRYLNRTWAWDGTNWTRLSSAVSPPPAQQFATAFDAANGRVIAVSGSETWIWDGSTWTRLSQSHAPTGAPYMAYFPSLKKVLAWGDGWSTRTGDLWSWDGSTWTLLQAGPSSAPSPNSLPATMTPAEAETAIRKLVTTARPVLLPSQLPSGFVDASVTASADYFNVEYRTSQRDKSIYFGIVVANPPPGNKQTVTKTVTYRGVTAQYQVYDPASPLSQRWLMWNEPGTMATQMTKAPGVPYFLSTDGLTDQEFWQLANSLK